MIPAQPTAHPVWASTNETPRRRRSLGPSNCWVHVSPAFVVCKMTAPNSPPIAHPALASMNVTAVSVSLVPLDWCVHVLPPSLVRTMLPSAPTAKVVCGSTTATPIKPPACGRGFCQNQPGSANDAPAWMLPMLNKIIKARQKVFMELPPGPTSSKSAGARSEMHLFHDIRAELERLKALLEYARSEGLVDRNVASAVKLPKVSYDQGLALLERDWPILGLLPAWVSPDCQSRYLHRLAA